MADKHPALTATSAQAARPEAKPYWLWSAADRGFGLRVHPRNRRGAFVRAYYYVTRVKREGKRETEARFTKLVDYRDGGFAEARNLALKLAGEAAQARLDGTEFRPEKILATEDHTGLKLLAEAWAHYFEKHLKDKASGAGVDATVRKHAGALLARAVREIDAEEIRAAIAPASASVQRHLLQSLKAACYYASAHSKASGWPRGLANPFEGVKLPKLAARTRKLTGKDLVNFANAAANYEDAAAGTFLLALLTCGGRRDELREARVHEWDSKRRRLRLDAARMKSRVPGVLTFGALIAKRIDALVEGRTPGAAIFRGEDPQGFRDFRKPMARVLDAAGCRTVTFHDLRRSCGNALIVAGFDVAQAHQFLNHIPDAVTSAYLVLDADHEKRDEMARAVEAALGLGRRPKAAALKRTAKAAVRRAA